MAKITIGFGVALIVLGIIGFLPHRAPTALIPTYIGAALAICGAIALKPEMRKHAMHAAVILGLIGFLGAGGAWSPPRSRAHSHRRWRCSARSGPQCSR